MVQNISVTKVNYTKKESPGWDMSNKNTDMPEIDTRLWKLLLSYQFLTRNKLNNVYSKSPKYVKKLW